MDEQLTVEGSDPLLWQFLRVHDPALAESLLADVIEKQADPIITKILRSKLRVSLNGAQGDQQNQDALEIAGALRVTLIADLRAQQINPQHKPIRSFSDYVAIKTYSACADYFREKNPRRSSLKNLLRYQLKQDSRFALWKTQHRWLAGFSVWREAAVNSSTSLPAAEEILEMYPAKSASDVSATELLVGIFELAGRPVTFEQVVTLAAEVWGIKDPALESVDMSDRSMEQEAVDPPPGVDLLLEQRLYLKRLWEEVCQLPVLQRAALLLNLRDAHGGSAVFFIPHLGIASQAQIGQLMGLSGDEFSLLWNELPLDDAQIADRFSITRQQVINLRKTARERLARRMAKLESGTDTSNKQL